MKETCIKTGLILVIGLFTFHITSSCVNKRKALGMSGMFQFCCGDITGSNESIPLENIQSDTIPLIRNNPTSNNLNNDEATAHSSNPTNSTKYSINTKQLKHIDSDSSSDENVEFDYRQFRNNIRDTNNNIRKRNK